MELWAYNAIYAGQPWSTKFLAILYLPLTPTHCKLIDAIIYQEKRKPTDRPAAYYLATLFFSMLLPYSSLSFHAADFVKQNREQSLEPVYWSHQPNDV